MGEKRNIYNVLVKKPERNMQLVRHRRRCEYNIKIDIQTKGWKIEDWINLAQDRDKCRAVLKTVVSHSFA
jgi:hypothetical protein